MRNADLDHLDGEEFIAEMQRRLVAGANAAKRRALSLPPREQAAALAEIAAALLRGLDRLQATIDAAKSRLPDA